MGHVHKYPIFKAQQLVLHTNNYLGHIHRNYLGHFHRKHCQVYILRTIKFGIVKVYTLSQHSENEKSKYNTNILLIVVRIQEPKTFIDQGSYLVFISLV